MAGSEWWRSRAGVASADHLLTLKFHGGTTRLTTVALVPDTADIGDAVSEFCKAQTDTGDTPSMSSLVS